MKRRRSVVGAALLLAAVFIFGCGLPSLKPAETEPTENTLEPTSTPESTNNPIPTNTPTPTSTPVPTSTPMPTSTPDTSVCGLLGSEVTDIFGTRALSIEKESNNKCKVMTTFTGHEFTNHVTLFNALRGMMMSENWREDLAYQADGPGGTATGFHGEVGLCLLSVESKPVDEGLCSKNEPFSVCWERLTDDQKIYKLLIDCKPDSGATDTTTDSEPVRIQFTAGSISGQKSGTLAAFGRDRYVLRAAADQVMTVNLRITSGTEALLIIWGKDGSVFVTDHSTTTYWQGKLPLTQDYFITVVASPDGPVSYVLEVTIPPL